MTAGGDDTVFAFRVALYGDYVLLRPPFKGTTLLLWLGAPLVLLVLLAAILLGIRRRIVPTPPPLSDEERERIAALLKR